jgi:hypothetical protein
VRGFGFGASWGESGPLRSDTVFMGCCKPCWPPMWGPATLPRTRGKWVGDFAVSGKSCCLPRQQGCSSPRKCIFTADPETPLAPLLTRQRRHGSRWPWTAAALLPLSRGQPCWPPMWGPATLPRTLAKRVGDFVVSGNRASSPASRAARPQSGSRAAAVQGGGTSVTVRRRHLPLSPCGRRAAIRK